jgi:hypothetical protein
MVLSSSSDGVTFLLKKMILGNLNLTGSEHMICEFQKQHELDYADRRKAMDEKNASTALDNTADDIQEARDDNGGDDARALQEMIVLISRGLAKETRGASSLCLRPVNPSNQHAKASGRTLSLGGSQISARKGREFISLQHYFTLAPKCRSVTSNTSPREERRGSRISFNGVRIF